MNWNPFWAGNPSGIGQQTAASQLIIAGTRTRGSGAKRKRRASKKTAPRKRRASAAKARAPKRRARMVKGSAAAKAYMAKIRRKRRK